MITGPEGYDSTKLAMDYHAVGWGECAAEVGRYLVTMEGLDERDPLRLRLLSHLQSFHREHPPSAVPSAVPAASTTLTSTSTASSYEPPPSTVSAGMPPGPGTMPPLLGGWGQYPGQYPQQQHGKPYRPWGAELAYWPWALDAQSTRSRSFDAKADNKNTNEIVEFTFFLQY